MRNVVKVVMMMLILTMMLNGAAPVVENDDKPAKGDWNFQMEKEWTVSTAGEDVLVHPASLNFDEAGNLYLLDHKHGKVFAFDPAGKHLHTFGKKGEGPGELRRPLALYTIGRYLVVQDQGHRLHYFTHKGEYKNSFFVGVSTNPRAFIDIYTLISLKSNPEKKTKTEILEIYDIKTQKKYRLAELKAEGALEGSSGSGKGDVSVSVMDPETTAQLLLSYNNKKLIIGKTDKYTIIKLDLSGKELLTFSINGRKAKPITAEYKKNFTLRLKEIPESVKKQIAANIPDNSTYFNDIQVDEKGLIYVFITDVSTKKARALDIFSPAGKYLYKSVLTMPEGYIIAGDIKFHGSNLYIVLEDDEGERELVKFKIKTPQL